MFRVYGESCVSNGVMQEWCQKFKYGQTDVHDKGGQGLKAVPKEDIEEQVDEVVIE